MHAMESRSSPILLSDITTPFSTLLCSLSGRVYNFDSDESFLYFFFEDEWPYKDETLRQAVCKFNGKSWKKIVAGTSWLNISK
ncbi:uncharacterized protein LOC125587947 isoform X8 [Brassica napus]|uniref:uncharacterized protein LOC125587947 isoform X8 n=1 Tax=Brassica napus TaxID=3708 RepID=UPI002079C30B|nr:uncharacterized protein LOC125587947 isoform X8 [Brassica napus]